MNLPDSPIGSHPLPPDFASEIARSTGRLGTLARAVYWWPELDSTNRVAAALADEDAPEGTVVLADAQTAGRGRLGRTWHSPAGAGLYVSVVLRPAAVSSLVTLAAGVALAEAVHELTGLRCALKWPNDLYVGPRKLAGILAEAGSAAAGNHVILGFGINVSAGSRPQDVGARATSLEEELGRPVSRSALLVECLSALSARYDDVQHGRSAGVLAAWREWAAPLLKRPVEWDTAGGVARGVAEDVDASGGLIVRTPGGTAVVVAGEVRWR